MLKGVLATLFKVGFEFLVSTDSPLNEGEENGDWLDGGDTDPTGESITYNFAYWVRNRCAQKASKWHKMAKVDGYYSTVGAKDRREKFKKIFKI